MPIMRGWSVYTLCRDILPIIQGIMGTYTICIPYNTLCIIIRPLNMVYEMVASMFTSMESGDPGILGSGDDGINTPYTHISSCTGNTYYIMGMGPYTMVPILPYHTIYPLITYHITAYHHITSYHGMRGSWDLGMMASNVMM